MSACPTPEKHVFTSRKAALNRARCRSLAHSHLTAYQCSGHWHLTTPKRGHQKGRR